MAPRNVRNFWIELDVDGRKERIATGPRSADGGFMLTIKMREKGTVKEALVIEGVVRADGKGLALLSYEAGAYHSDTVMETKR